MTEVVREGDCFVPFHFAEQLINSVTIADFDPKSFEPNFKQSAVNIYSDEVPEGIKMKETKIAGELEEQNSATKSEYLVKEGSYRDKNATN